MWTATQCSNLPGVTQRAHAITYLWQFWIQLGAEFVNTAQWIHLGDPEVNCDLRSPCHKKNVTWMAALFACTTAHSHKKSWDMRAKGRETGARSAQFPKTEKAVAGVSTIGIVQYGFLSKGTVVSRHFALEEINSRYKWKLHHSCIFNIGAVVFLVLCVMMLGLNQSPVCSVLAPP